MIHKGALSSVFNMSLGFTPVIISMLLCEFITQDASVYIGTGIGVVYSYYSLHRSNTRVPNFILYISTGVLVLLTIAALIPGNYVPPGALPMTLEASILIPMLSLYLHKRRFINHYLSKKDACHRHLFAQGAEAAVVAARIVLILGVLHFIAISLLAWLGSEPLGDTLLWVMFNGLPLMVFILCIVLNQIGICYFNKMMVHTEYVPIVNTKGDVIGKTLATEALSRKSSSIYPVIRIAISAHGMLFLCDRSPNCILDKGKTDIPMECNLRFGETLTEGVNRIMQNTFPTAPNLSPAFSIKYHFENAVTNRLVYLYFLDLSEDDAILCDPRFKGGKLWRFQQIEQNVNQNFFSSCFEEEYEHLETIIDIREKYKES